MNIAAHKLTTFIAHEGITQRAFADRVRVRSSTITRLLNGKRTPSLSLAYRIFEQTRGKVTQSDWLAPHTEKDSAEESASAEAGGEPLAEKRTRGRSKHHPVSQPVG